MTCLEAKHLTIARGRQLICQDLNLTMQKGEVWAILGPNGCGKTTLIHALADNYPKTSGELYLHEKPLAAFSRKAIARTMGVLLQDFTATFPQTVWQYCEASRFPHSTYFKRADTQDLKIIHDALAVMDLLPLAEKNILQLSGGEKRRLSIAAVIAQTPEIFLLDEPTNHLDVHHQVQTLSHFRQLVENQSASVLFACHDINLAQQFSTHALLIFPNGVTLQGRLADVLTQDNLSRLYRHQMRRVGEEKRFFWMAETG